MNAITMQLKEKMKKDFEELTKVTIVDGIAGKEIDSLYSYVYNNYALESIKQHLDYKILMSDIIGKNVVSKRFADKVISLFSKYQRDQLGLIIDCTKLLYYDPSFAGEIYSNQKEHNNTAFEPEPA